MRGLQKTGWVVLFLYVLFAFRTEAVGYNATSIEPVTNGGRIASSELIEVFELKKNRDSQFFCPYLIEAGFGDLLGSNSKPSTCARNSLVAFDWFSAECSVTSNEWAIIERDVSIYGYVTGSALARINPWYVPHYVSISVTHWPKDWSHELVGKHEMGFLIPKHDIQLTLHDSQLTTGNIGLSSNFIICVFENDDIANGGKEQKRRPNDEPPGKAIDWIWFAKPPTSFFWRFLYFGAPGFACSVAGFIFLYGPHRRPNLGAALYFIGLLCFAVATLALV